MNGDVVGVVLAGGRSRRMGRDKALLALDGSALVRRAASVLSAVCEQTVLAVAPGRRYSSVPLVHVEDRLADCGPLAGLEAALAWAAPRSVLVLACDLPRVEAALLRRLLGAGGGSLPASRPCARLASRDERLQPLCGLYSAACGEVFSELLDNGERSVLRALESIDSMRVAFDDIDPDPFLNVNTPADFESAGGQLAAF